MNKGIDYGMGQTNVDPTTGIRFGVISGNLLPWWDEEFETQWGDPTCPMCGNVNAVAKPGDESEVNPADYGPESNSDGNGYEKGTFGHGDYLCHACRYAFSSDQAYGDDPVGYTLDKDGYKAEMSVGGDIFVTKSRCYTRAQFCSPCAPGACHLEHPMPEGEKCYAFGHDWFEGGVAPYPVYRVEDDALVPPSEATS